MIKSVPIKDIVTDCKTQQRSVDDDVVKRYAALIKDGFKFPPIEIIYEVKTIICGMVSIGISLT